jgi:hypothetical protein
MSKAIHLLLLYALGGLLSSDLYLYIYNLTPVQLSVAGVIKQIASVCSITTVALFTSTQHPSSHQHYIPSTVLQPKFNAIPGAVNPMISGARIPEK